MVVDTAHTSLIRIESNIGKIVFIEQVYDDSTIKFIAIWLHVELYF